MQNPCVVCQNPKKGKRMNPEEKFGWKCRGKEGELNGEEMIPRRPWWRKIRTKWWVKHLILETFATLINFYYVIKVFHYFSYKSVTSN
jgi:hypothetical protein